MNDIKNNSHQPNLNSDLSSEFCNVFQIMAEFVAGYERLTNIQPSVSMFGSSRIRIDNQ